MNKKKCKDCNGTGQYVGLDEISECRTCCGIRVREGDTLRTYDPKQITCTFTDPKTGEGIDLFGRINNVDNVVRFTSKGKIDSLSVDLTFTTRDGTTLRDAMRDAMTGDAPYRSIAEAEKAGFSPAVEQWAKETFASYPPLRDDDPAARITTVHDESAIVWEEYLGDGRFGPEQADVPTRSINDITSTPCAPTRKERGPFPESVKELLALYATLEPKTPTESDVDRMLSLPSTGC